MSRQSATGMFILAAVFATAVGPQVGAQESDGKLKSVLLDGEDLRPLIDLNAPDAPEPDSQSPAQTAEQKLVSPILSGVAEDDVEEVDLPSPIIPGLRPIPAQPTAYQPSATKKSTSVARRSSADPLFDLGVSTLATPSGPKIRGVFVGSPAHRAGLKPGDTITAADGIAAKTSDELTKVLGPKFGQSARVSMGILRRGRKQTVMANITSAGTVSQSLADSAPRQFRRQPIAAQTVSTQPQTIYSPQPIATPQPPIPAASNVVPQPYPATSFPQAAPIYPQPQVVRYAPAPQPRYVAPRQNRPLVGDGGRLLGNGRLINSTLRLIGL